MEKQNDKKVILGLLLTLLLLLTLFTGFMIGVLYKNHETQTIWNKCKQIIIDVSGMDYESIRQDIIYCELLLNKTNMVEIN